VDRDCRWNQEYLKEFFVDVEVVVLIGEKVTEEKVAPLIHSSFVPQLGRYWEIEEDFGGGIEMDEYLVWM
jgi:hypothetical protein